MSSACIDLLQSRPMASQTGAIGPALQELQPLKPFTTFKIGGPARYFSRAASIEEFRGVSELAGKLSLPLFILGGGSNILVSDSGFEGVVVHPVCRGVEILREDANTVTLEVSAGETWDDLVQHAVERNWWGIENLSHIPGQSGVALVQNIGAYGQQVSDVVQSARVLEIATGALHVLSAADCGFGYRRSIFNTTARGKLIIVGLTLRLSKHERSQLEYPDVQAYFQERGIKQPSLHEIRRPSFPSATGNFLSRERSGVEMPVHSSRIWCFPKPNTKTCGRSCGGIFRREKCRDWKRSGIVSRRRTGSRFPPPS